MTFGGVGYFAAMGNTGQSDADKLIKLALDQGINFFDTANAYSEGESEKITGQALRNLGVNRHDIFLSTKVFLRMGPGINNVGGSRLHIHRSVDESLKRLGLDHIDLLYIHSFDTLTPIEETLRGLDEMVRAGKVRYIGASNVPAWQVMKALSFSEKYGWARFEAMQYYYSLLGRDVENEILPLCIDQKLSLIPWSPLAGGFLSGKYRRGQTSQGDGSRRDTFDFPPIPDKEKAYDIIEEMDKIAQKRPGATVAQIALAWLMRQPTVTSTIFGSKKVEQLEGNVKASDIELTDEEVQTLSKLSQPNAIYPYYMIQRQNAHRTGKFTVVK
eukprot:CAMPEP_0176451730 /NCGR_PEP_ID=MMETSP0127-20121128/28044_1 /TAXON_ID=938130 /ORGANISM="Platyophrya macrostoma, Strain WH" /LENGTH=328 /DNA_ID=CAMNT_0017839909 /DNA_START=82 /DNA_END=1068 /DNA_ORIENTATION=+